MLRNSPSEQDSTRPQPQPVHVRYSRSLSKLPLWLLLLACISGSILITIYYHKSTTEILFADYHKVLPAIDQTLQGNFSISLLSFQSAGHFHPALMAWCIANAVLFGSSAYVEMLVCTILISATFVNLYRNMPSHAADSSCFSAISSKLLVVIGLFPILYNLNKWQHFTFPFTGIEYFLSLFLFVSLFAWVTSFLSGQFTSFRRLLLITSIPVVVLGFSGGRGPIVSLTLAAFLCIPLASCDSFGLRVSRSHTFLIISVSLVSAYIYRQLLNSAPVPDPQGITSVLAITPKFVGNLFASQLFGNSYIVNKPWESQAWQIGLIFAALMSCSVLFVRQQNAFPLLLALYAIIGAFSIAAARLPYGASYALTSKYIPVIDFLAIGAVLSLATATAIGKCERLLRRSAAILLIGILWSGFFVSYWTEQQIAPHRQAIYLGIQKFFFAPSFYTEYSRYVSPDPEVARETAAIIRRNALSAARDLEVGKITNYCVVHGLTVIDDWANPTSSTAAFFLYSHRAPSQLVMSFDCGIDSAVPIGLTVNNIEHDLSISKGIHSVSIPVDQNNAECILNIPESSIPLIRFTATLQ